MINEQTYSTALSNTQAQDANAESTISLFYLSTDDDLYIVTDNFERILIAGEPNLPVALTNYEYV
jgi:uncharacterized protein YlxP (DUF503 family)